jgi:hypothetical protein
LSVRRRRASGVLPWLVGILLAACTRLPQIDSGECGNGVVEPPEDCDTFDLDGASCRPRGSAGECHLDCARTSDGQTACPAGWGCDLGGICRRPTGELTAAGEFEVGTAFSLASGDFDGDGRFDLMSAEAPDRFGVTRVKFHYFDEEGELTDTLPYPPLLIAPALARMSNDARSDVVFSDGRVGVLLGRPDRSWVPETFSSYRIPGSAIRTLTVSDDPIATASAFIVFAKFDDVSGVYVPDVNTNGVPRLLGALPRPIEDLLGDPVGGDVIEGTPCRQAFVAVAGETRFLMLDVCTQDGDGATVFRPEMIVSEIALDPPEPIAFAPRLADMNGDGHLDVIIGSSTRAFVAYGDGQTLASAVPFPFTAPGADAPTPDMPMPLAAGDVSGDGVVDLVFPDYFAVSAPSPIAPRQTVYGYAGGTGPWTAAAVTDLNANGFPDVVLSSSERAGIDFFNGTGTGYMTYFAVPTTRPVQRLVTGDYDGDLIQDIAFTQSVASDPDELAVMIAFGVPFGPPLPPVAVARLPNIEELETYREGPIGHLLLSSSEGSGDTRQGVLTLLAGSGDRVPTAFYELTTFAADSSVADSAAARVLGGSFLGSAPDDVLALAFFDVPTDAGAQFWLLPAITSSAGTPALLAGTLPPEYHPVTAGGAGLSLAMIAADIDGDHRQEAILGAPAIDDAHCGLLTLEAEPDRIVILGNSIIAQPCAHVELLAEDADGDGQRDIVLLGARADGSQRQLSVFWNDGAGGFSADQSSSIADAAVAPQAVAVLPGTPAHGPSVAYATPFGIERVTIGPERALSTPEPLVSVEECTGLTAADLNGDGTVDLAAAVRGNLRVFESALEGP